MVKGAHTVGRIIFKDIKFRGYSKFHLNKNFRRKNFEVIGYGQTAKFLPHVATRCMNNLRMRR